MVVKRKGGRGVLPVCAAVREKGAECVRQTREKRGITFFLRTGRGDKLNGFEPRTKITKGGLTIDAWS